MQSAQKVVEKTAEQTAEQTQRIWGLLEINELLYASAFLIAPIAYGILSTALAFNARVSNWSDHWSRQREPGALALPHQARMYGYHAFNVISSILVFMMLRYNGTYSAASAGIHAVINAVLWRTCTLLSRYSFASTWLVAVTSAVGFLVAFLAYDRVLSLLPRDLGFVRYIGPVALLIESGYHALLYAGTLLLSRPPPLGPRRA